MMHRLMNNNSLLFIDGGEANSFYDSLRLCTFML